MIPASFNVCIVFIAFWSCSCCFFHFAVFFVDFVEAVELELVFVLLAGVGVEEEGEGDGWVTRSAVPLHIDSCLATLSELNFRPHSWQGTRFWVTAVDDSTLVDDRLVGWMGCSSIEGTRDVLLLLRLRESRLAGDLDSVSYGWIDLYIWRDRKCEIWLFRGYNIDRYSRTYISRSSWRWFTGVIYWTISITSENWISITNKSFYLVYSFFDEPPICLYQRTFSHKLDKALENYHIYIYNVRNKQNQMEQRVSGREKGIVICTVLLWIEMNLRMRYLRLIHLIRFFIELIYIFTANDSFQQRLFDCWSGSGQLST